MLLLLWFFPTYEPESLSASTYLLWYLLYAGLFALFYVFSSPFTTNRELRRSWSGYVYFSTILYIWLGMAVAFHLPILHYDVKVPVSLFSPLFLGSALTLFACEGALKLLNRWYVFHVGFRQNSLEVMQNSFVVSLTCCLVYSQCGSVTNESLLRASFLDGASAATTAAAKALQPELDAGIDRMCIVLFSGHVDSKYAHLPMVLVLWCTAMSALVLNFFIERISGYRGMFSDLPTPEQMAAAEVRESTAVGSTAGNLSEAEEEDVCVAGSLSPRVGGGANDRTALQKDAAHRISLGAAPLSIIPPVSTASGSGNPVAPASAGSYKSRLAKIRPLLFRDMLDPPMLEMVPWYALLTTITGVDMLIHLKLFVGRFDMRTLQAVTPNSFHYTQPIYTSSNPPTHALSGAGPAASAPTTPGLSTPGFTSSNSLSTSTSFTGLSGLGMGGGGGLGGGMGSAANSTPNSPRGGGRRLSSAGLDVPSSLFSSASSGPHVHPHHLDAPLVYDHYAEDDELWFDWMADCGDGWNSSYQVCRVLAKPLLHVSVRRKGGLKPGALYLPRAKMLLIGGDLAYPSPNEANYEQRFFRPFQCALPPPLNYDPSALSMHKPPIPGGVAGLRTYAGPTCFAIPGNHDWFDGLQTYLRYVCSRDWLGGWLLPQERSFFALQLPQGWWLFGLDNALSNDIDALQFKYFASIIERMGEDDRVIIATHEPDWVIDTHDQRTSGENTNYLIKILKGKVALRMAGDIHNYTRHMPSPLIPGIGTQPSLQSTVRAAAQAFNASAASSLFRGMIDSIFSSRAQDDADDSEHNTVSGVVDATLRNAAETGARLQASECDEHDDHDAASGSVPGSQRTTYKSMLYSRFTGWGGDGEGIFMEDIRDTLNPSMPLLRTQSMPAIPHGFDGAERFTAPTFSSAAKPPLVPSSAGGKQKKKSLRRSPPAAMKAAVAEEDDEAAASGSFLPPAPANVERQARSASPATFIPSKAKQKRQAAAAAAAATVASVDPLLAVLGPQAAPVPAASWSNLDPPPEMEDDSASSSSSQTPLTAQERRNKKKREAKARKQAQRAAEGLSASNTANSSYANLLSSSSSRTSLDAASPPRAPGAQKLRPSVRPSDSTPHLDAIHAWSADEVLEWLSSVGVEDGAIHAAFSAQDIDGRLLAELDHADLSQELHIASQLKRKKILAEIRALIAAANKKDAAAAAAAASAESRPLSDDDVDDEEGRNSEDEQIAENILSGSSINLSEMSGSGSRSRKASPSPPAAASAVYLPPGFSSSSRAATGPELSLTMQDVSENFQFGRRNVDVISMGPNEDLGVANAAASIQALGEGHHVHLSASPPAPARPTPTPSPLLEGEADDSVAASLSPLSMAARKRAAKKARQQQASVHHLDPRSLGFSAAASSSSRSASPAFAAAPNLSTSASSASFLAPSRRQEESLFGSAATGTMANSPRRSATGSQNNGGANSKGAASSSSAAAASSHSRHSSRASAGGGSGRHPQAPLYNNASSAPIPTDVRESINISFPEGSDAPKELLSHLTAGMEEEDADAVGCIGGTENVRPPPVLIVSGGGGAFMHPTHCPDPEPILFRGNRYVRASSYPPVALSRAYALLNLFGFRKQNWRFDMFGGFLYFALAVSVLPICNLQPILQASSWYDVILQYVLAVWQNHTQLFLQGYVSVFTFVGIWISLLSFGEVPWPWYKRFLIGTCHTLAHSLSAISAVVLLESCIELGRDRKIIGQGDFLWATFAKNFPEGLARIESADTQFLGGILGALMRGLSNLFDVPDNIASLKLQMCESYSTVTRPTLLLYYLNNGLYLWVLMTPLVSFMFGAYLYVASAFLNAHYTEAFSSLRIEGYKNVVRFHINRRADLEVYTLGLDKVPTRWTKDAKWSGITEPGSTPSHAWARPSVLKPAEGQPDRIKLIDYLIIPKNPRNKNAWGTNGSASSGGKKGGMDTAAAAQR